MVRDGLLLDVFEAFDKAAIRYCLLRGYDELLTATASREVDLLVAPDHLPLLAHTVAMQGFVTLPSWGYAPHHFFVAFDEENDSWLKLDVVTDLIYGKPIRCIGIDLTAKCLHDRRRCKPTYIPSPEDEFTTLLLHCLLDKGRFRPAYCTRIQTLRHAVADERRLAKQVERYVAPVMTWNMLTRAMDTEDWPSLTNRRAEVLRHLFWATPLKSSRRLLAAWLLRRLRPVLFALRRRGLSVALLAPDGAGKTTLARELTRDDYLRARLIYMGTNISTSTVGLPTTQWLQERVKAPNGAKPSPKRLVLKGLSFSNRLVEQWYRYGMSLYHTLRGRFVIFDRYVYDSYLAPRASTLRKRLRRWLLTGTCPSPDLVILLDAPGTRLYERKGEHTPERLERQRQVYLGLKEKIPNMMVIDATRGAHEVRRDVIALIWKYYGDRVRRQDMYGTRG